MGIRFFLVFLTFFIVASIFLFYQKVKTLNFGVDTKDTPLMVLKDSKIYDITYDGILAYLQSREAKRYIDRYELYKLYSNKKDKNVTQKLWADKGVLKNNILKLRGNVVYKDTNEQTLKSQTVTYNLKKDILSSNTFFEANYKESNVTGSSFIYYKKDKKLIANNIKAIIVMED